MINRDIITVTKGIRRTRVYLYRDDARDDLASFAFGTPPSPPRPPYLHRTLPPFPLVLPATLPHRPPEPSDNLSAYVLGAGGA